MSTPEHPLTVHERAARVRLLLFDVDGVLTDGVVVMHADGTESKGFHIRDGAAIVWAQRAGIPVGFLSSRASGATSQRAAQLAIRLVVQGVPDKLAAYEQIVRDAGLDDDAVAYMGDDLVDVPVLGACRAVGRAGGCGPRGARRGALGQPMRRRARRRARIHRDGPSGAAALG